MFLIIILVIALNLVNSQELACSSTHNQNVYSFTLPAKSPLGEINILYVQHDAIRKIPLATTSLMNSLNHQMNFPRVDAFRTYDCNSIADKQTLCKNSYKMTAEQEKLSGKTAFDRGHLAPANPFRFSEEAIRDTFYCVNIAPQDPYTNQGPWSTVEDKAHSYLETKAGYVITGLCDLDDRYSPTAEGYKIPACFWKLICYKDDSGSTQVVGFIGNNTLLGANDSKGKEERKISTTTPKSQQDILNVMTRDSFINAAWSGGEDYLLRNRNEKRLPTAAACKLKKTLSEAVKNEWSNLMKDVEV